MAWLKAKNLQPANGTPVLKGEAGQAVYYDNDNDVIVPTSASDLPKPVEQPNFLGIRGNVPAGEATLQDVFNEIKKLRADLVLKGAL